MSNPTPKCFYGGYWVSTELKESMSFDGDRNLNANLANSANYTNYIISAIREIRKIRISPAGNLPNSSHSVELLREAAGGNH